MPNSLLLVAFATWVAAAVFAACRCGTRVARGLLAAGCIAGIIAAIAALPHGTFNTILPTRLAGDPVDFEMSPEALWLFGFGLAPAALACALSTPKRDGESGWLFGAAASLIGALGVFGVRHGAGFLIAWEIMSFGGAMMILSERLASDVGGPTLFMLGLLEVGAVALLLAILLLATAGHSFAFDAYGQSLTQAPPVLLAGVGVLFVIGFGAKLGLLPFYEWFPTAYGAGSGASGALLSGVVMNAAFFGLSRGLLQWIPPQSSLSVGLGIFTICVGVISAILTALYAFQQEDWRALLSFSSAENASIAVTMLGAALLFRGQGEPLLASLAWVVALLHLAGHALAKGGLFLTADGVYHATKRYSIFHTDLMRRSSWLFGIGALFAAMSLAAMPPQAGFVSEWYVFQTVFQGFHLNTLAARLTLALAGAGLALTAAVAFATYVKAFGVGLLGRSPAVEGTVPKAVAISVGILGLCVLALAVGMPFWLTSLDVAAANGFGKNAAQAMHDGLLLVPLTAKFAFISPTMLVIIMPLLAILPITMVLINHRYNVRRVPVWYGGLAQDPQRVSTTALTFSNALRTFYSFIYRPTQETERETYRVRYYVRRLTFTHDVAPVFGPYLFSPITRLVYRAARWLRLMQSGHLNLYLAVIGVLLIIILALTLF